MNLPAEQLWHHPIVQHALRVLDAQALDAQALDAQHDALDAQVLDAQTLDLPPAQAPRQLKIPFPKEVPRWQLLSCVKKALTAGQLLDPEKAPLPGPERAPWRIELEALCRPVWVQAGRPAEWDPVDAVWDLEVGLNWLQVKAGLLPTSTDLLPD